MPAAKVSGGSSRGSAKPKKKAPPKAPRQVIKAQPAPRATKTTGSRTAAFNRSRAAAARKAGNVGRGAHRTGRKQPVRKAADINLNPFQGVDFGGAVRGIGDMIRQSNPIDQLYNQVGNRIKNPKR